MKQFSMLLLSALSLVWAADEPKPNPVVEKAMAAALADAEKGYDSYRAILSKATDKAVKDMEKAKLDAMKKGDLASANELDARIKELKEGGLEKLVAERKKAGGDLLGDVPTSIVGKWWDKAGARKFVFNKDRSVSIVLDTGAVFGDGTWVMDGDKTLITWEKWGKEVVSFSGKAKQISSDTHGWVGIYSD
jgi:hypothetical protein